MIYITTGRTLSNDKWYFPACASYSCDTRMAETSNRHNTIARPVTVVVAIVAAFVCAGIGIRLGITIGHCIYIALTLFSLSGNHVTMKLGHVFGPAVVLVLLKDANKRHRYLHVRQFVRDGSIGKNPDSGVGNCICICLDVASCL